MGKVTIGSIVTTSIISAFTIAAALIWKDVIDGVIKLIFPEGQLLIKLLAAIFATILVVIFIYIILAAQSETELVLKKFKFGKKKQKKIR